MKSRHINVGALRRAQIVGAAVALIAERGLDRLSLSAIEQRAGMSRGQLTYYFHTKEDILLAVFDHHVEMMRQRIGGECQAKTDGGGWDLARLLMERLLVTGPVNPTFGALQYTFLAQMGHRDDFRQRLAALYEEWRDNMAAGLSKDLKGVPEDPPASPRALATLIQAILHGLVMQRAVDPVAFDGAEMRALCLDLLGKYLGLAPTVNAEPSPKRSRDKTRRKPTGARSKRGSHE